MLTLVGFENLFKQLDLASFGSKATFQSTHMHSSIGLEIAFQHKKYDSQDGISAERMRYDSELYMWRNPPTSYVRSHYAPANKGWLTPLNTIYFC
jgi:hypothetical protein